MKSENDKQLAGGRIERVEAMLFSASDDTPNSPESANWQAGVMRDIRRTVIDREPQRELIRFAVLSSSFAIALLLLALRLELDPVQEFAALTLESELNVDADYDLIPMEQLVP